MKKNCQNKKWSEKDSRQYAVSSRQIFYCLLLTAYSLLPFVGCAKQIVIVTDAKYYEGKIDVLTEQLLKSIPKEKLEANEAKPINRVAVMDFVNSNGKVSALGKYLGSKLSETIIEKNYFKVAHRGEVLDALKASNIAFTGIMNNETIKKLGEKLQIDAIFFGEIVDLGTNIDVNIKFIASKNGEMLSAASTDIERTKPAVNLMETY